MATQFEVVTSSTYPSSPVVGQCVYNSDTGSAEWWDGENWISNLGAKFYTADAYIDSIYSNSSYAQSVHQVNNRIFLCSGYPGNGAPDYMTISIYDYDPILKTTTLHQQGLGADMVYRSSSTKTAIYNMCFESSADGLTIIVGAYGEKNATRNQTYEGAVWIFRAPDLSSQYSEIQKIGVNEADMTAIGHDGKNLYFGEHCGFLSDVSDEFIYISTRGRYWIDTNVYTGGFEIHRKNGGTGDYELFQRIDPSTDFATTVKTIKLTTPPRLTDDGQNLVFLDMSGYRAIMNYSWDGNTFNTESFIPVSIGSELTTNGSGGLYNDDFYVVNAPSSDFYVSKFSRDPDGTFTTKKTINFTGLLPIFGSSSTYNTTNKHIDRSTGKFAYLARYFDPLFGGYKGNYIHTLIDLSSMDFDTPSPSSANFESLGVANHPTLGPNFKSSAWNEQLAYSSYANGLIVSAIHFENEIKFVIKDTK